MEVRSAVRLDRPVSAVGYGMWGLAGWKDTDDAEVQRALDLAVEAGMTFFDTAFAYGDGRSERILGDLVRRHPGKRLYLTSKIPPKNRTWPAPAKASLDDCFPPDYIREYVERTLDNLALPSLDLMQFHVWQDSWTKDDRWRHTMDELKRKGLIRATGISLNRWEPWNGMAAVRSGGVDAVQVVYNVFDQNPEDELFPLCREMGVAIIARVPFDEGSLAGQLKVNTEFPEGDFRRGYFNPENKAATLGRLEALHKDVPAGMSLPELALRFILTSSDVTTVIPGMRRTASVAANVAAWKAGPLDPALMATLRAHRWDRKPVKRPD